MKARPDDLLCPCCGGRLMAQPVTVVGDTERQWFICATDTCPLSSMHVWWRWP